MPWGNAPTCKTLPSLAGHAHRAAPPGGGAPGCPADKFCSRPWPRFVCETQAHLRVFGTGAAGPPGAPRGARYKPACCAAMGGLRAFS